MIYIRSLKNNILVCLVLLGLSIASANAVIIDFEEIDNSAGNVFSGSSLDSKGFNLSTPGPTTNNIFHWGQFSPNNADPGGVTFTHNWPDLTTTLTQIGGGAFDLESIDFEHDVVNYDFGLSTPSFSVTGFYQGGGSVSSNIVVDQVPGLESFHFNWAMLSSVTIGAPWGQEVGFANFQMDNIVVNSSIPPVPIPAAVWLFGTALIGLVGFSGRRNTARL